MKLAFPIVPTARTAWLAALAAPLAIVIAAAAPGAWVIAPAAGVALLMSRQWFLRRSERVRQA